MNVELAEVAAGLPVAASLALAGGLTSFREERRRAALNEAIHELRRPLQVLSLTLPADAPTAAPAESSLQLARVALDRLDREINGVSREEEVSEVSVRHLVEEAGRRWRGAVRRNGGSLELELDGEDTWVECSHFELSQALDNLLSNAVDHGGGEVRIRWRREGGWVSVSVIDSGVVTRAKTAGRRSYRGRWFRRGHGLRVVGRTARNHGGSFVLRRAQQGAEARLRLPVLHQVGEG